MTKSFNNKLTDLLKKDLRFVDEESGEIIRSEIINEALKIDKKLIEALLSEKDIKEKFFTEIKEHWVFEINKFIEFIQDKNFLSDSYTKFKNKIGLNIDGKFLNERKEVSLVWPFKDCVLEGGMTKEDQKRNEIFFNEILAQDEIDRLLDSKVLTNFKRVTAKGEEKVTDFKRDKDGIIRENLIIKGNNLLALHSLRKEFQERVKLIYIDPPYNTGKDRFGYNDKFNHSAWLTFMKNRLEIAKDLLKKDGLILVQCDDNEQAYLKIIMDEIFNRTNFINTIVWLNKEGGGKSDSKFFIKKEEYCLCYAKDIEFVSINRRLLKEDSSYSFSDEYVKERGKYKLIKLNSFSIQYSKSLDYEIELPNGEKVLPSENGKRGCWRWGKDQYEFGLKNDFIEFKENQDGKMWVYTKQYFKIDHKGNPIERSLPFLTRIDEFSATTATKEQEKLFGKKLFAYPKPEGYIKRLLDITTNSKDIVMDYHMGSGTTCAVAHKMNRQFIGVEQMDYIENIPVKRLKNVIGGEEGGISKDVNWKGSGDFVYCELLEFNEEAVDKIESAKITENLLKIWEEMVDHYFLNYDVDIKRFNDNQEDFKALPLEKQKKLLVEMLNKNQLYVNLSEIEDSQFKVSKEDKELNKKFYK